MPDGQVSSPLRFLETLWPDGIGASSLVLWTARDKKSFWFQSLEESAQAAEGLTKSDQLYYGVALQDRAQALKTAQGRKRRLPTVRGSSNTATAIPGLWADIDIRGTNHQQKQYPPTMDAALELLEALPFPPTVLVSTGFGLHAYWLFREPWFFQSSEDREEAQALLRRLQFALQFEAQKQAWELDNTADFARLLRLPGTFNHKVSPPRRVEPLRFHPEARYNPDDFDNLLPPQEEKRQGSPQRRQKAVNGPLPNLDAIVAGCAWMCHCYEDRFHLSEPEWYAALSIVGRCTDNSGRSGRALAHSWSQGHPDYLEMDTDRKLDHALSSAGPRTCKSIASNLGALERYCRICPHFDRIKSPISLGVVAAKVRGGAVVKNRVVVVVNNEEKRVNDEALAALRDHPQLFSRGDVLVQAVFQPTARFVPVQEATLRELLAERIDFKKLSAGETPTQISVNPPQQCYRALLARGSWPELRPVAGIAQCPRLRPDGSILQQPGYDPSTGLLYQPNGSYPPVPEHPSQEQVTAALAELEEVVCDFPFSGRVYFAAWLAALLTPLAWYAFSGNAPLMLVDANTRGAGKGLLVRVISFIATGLDIACMPYSQNHEEQRKAILGIALEGHPTVLLDNVAGNFGSPILDAALTTTTWRDRLLGVNRMVTAPLEIVWFVTGNNIVVVGDTVRRCLHIRLKSPEEFPEERSDFAHPHLMEWLEARREQLTVAALTLLRAYWVAGKPAQRLTPWGSFENWSALVRGCVVWLGLPDPGRTRVELRSAAGDGPALENLLRGFEQLLQSQELHGATAGEVLFALEDSPGEYSLLRDALVELIPQLKTGKLPTAGQIGDLFRRNQERLIAGRVVESVRKTKHGTLWTIRSAVQERESTGDAGDAGDAA